MMEVHTGPIIIFDPSRFGLPPIPIQNPFTDTAIEEWDKRLTQGYRITAVSGSDDKGTNPKEGFYGMTSTEVYATELSRPALIEAVQAGHAYVRTFGASGIPPLGIPPSPTLEMKAVAPDGQEGMFGDTLAADQAEVTITVDKGLGQTLEIIRNGEIVQTVPITSDHFVYPFQAIRAEDEGPLGTYWRIQTSTTRIIGARVLTTIGNPIFLKGA
jgi:hypothetical protein